MIKRATSSFLIFMAAFSVVISSVVPHHHHHGDESVICIADDLQAENHDCCEGEHHSADGSCCGVKTNLVTHSGDSRKQEFHCNCDSDHLFHGGHLYIILASLAENGFFADVTRDKPCEFPPYSNRYHSVLTNGHIGLRAPPAA